MSIPALLLACSVHADDALLLSIAYVHSRGNPYAVVDVSLDAVERDDDIGDPVAAKTAVAGILAMGGEPVLGLLPVRLEWAVEFGKTLDDLLAPCGNIAIASAKLSEFDYACRSRGSQTGSRRRSCTLDLYGRRLGLLALRRAVEADLTLGQPFSGGSVELIRDSVPEEGDLFFPTAPLPPAAAWLPKAP